MFKAVAPSGVLGCLDNFGFRNRVAIYLSVSLSHHFIPGKPYSGCNKGKACAYSLGQRVRICPALSVFIDVKYDAPEVFQVDLVHDAGVRRHHTEILERALTPAQE